MSHEIQLHETTLEDVKAISRRLRGEDVAEVSAATGMPLEAALIASYEASKFCMTATLCGVPIMLFGVSQITPEVGCIWMRSTPKARNYGKEILSECEAVIKACLTEYRVLTCMVDFRNLLYPRWLKWLEFEPILEWGKWGAEERPFMQFARCGNV